MLKKSNGGENQKMSNKREWLIQIRKAKGFTRTDMVKKIKITQQMYYYIENNQRNPSVELAQKIAEVLGFDWTMFYPSKKKKGK
mgnify:CR=1 FL=1